MSNRNEETVTRYMPTYINKDGMRRILGTAQGRFTKATAEEAQSAVDSLLSNNTEDCLRECYGKQSIGTFRVDPIECWPVHFDPIGIFVHDPESPFEMNYKEILDKVRAKH